MELKIGSLVLSNFLEVESKSSAGGARANKISSLIVNSGKSVLPYVGSKTEASSTKPKIKNLSKLKVKGFRGFNESQEFDLSKRFTFIYGLNGTGKSSFCEALEYSLTGKVNEASSKRFEPSQYVNNNSSSTAEVLLTVEYDNGGLAPAIKDPLENEFLFIERTRIEAFARVSSYTPQGQQQRLSTLFGLEEFNDFCSGFNKTIEHKLPITPIKKKELEVKEKEVEKSKLVAENKKSEIEGYGARKESLLSKYPNQKLVSEVLTLLTSDTDGLILKKKDEIEKLSKIFFKPVDKVQEFLGALVSLIQKFSIFNNLSDEVKKFRDEINFIDLYSAIKKMSSSPMDSCPACDTPISNVTTNPFVKAEGQLKILEEISAKQKSLQEKEKSISESLIKLSSELKSVDISIAFTLYNFNQEHESIKSRLEKKISEWIKWNSENKELFEKVAGYKKELESLEKDYRECSTITELYKAAYKEKNRAEKIIGEFTTANKDLITKVEEERKEISHYLRYSGAYESFINKLKSYSEGLPLKLAKSLDKKVVEIYNAINKHPYNHEVLESIRLPTKPNDGIKIRYLDGTTEDALRVLSEGHLRCLGLSILLAKNIHNDHNVIIFDDVVNAIDDEHRAGIINELFSNSLLSEKQMILTTHGEDFIKRLENQLLSKGLNKKLTRYDFVRNHDSRELLIEPNLNRHYLVKAENNFKKGLIKDGLMECRRSLEELAPRLWKKMKTEGLDPTLTVKLRAPSTSPDLYNLIDGLIGYITEIEKKPGIINFSKHRQCLMEIKDVSKKNQVTWNLLNKGTHEEDRDEEFDENQAKELFELCLEFEGLIKNYSREEFKIDTTITAN
ncbi:MAG: AAA family ATPase [Gammaproteobacteria bacterium]|nr:AAA family ATPase [Gammaproteobacteria bacterium]